MSETPQRFDIPTAARMPLEIFRAMRAYFEKVVEAMKKHGAVYVAATGGAAALISKRIVGAEVIAYEDLGAEAIRKLTVEDFPVIVAQDAKGGHIYTEGQEKYRK